MRNKRVEGRTLKAVVFDFDGVIANSEPLHFRAFREVLADEGEPLTQADYYGRYLGFDDAGVFRAIAEERHLAWTASRIADLVSTKAARIELLEKDVSVLFPGAAAAIRRTAAVLPVAIASGALGFEIRRVLRRERLIDCFAVIVAAEDTPVSKPAPDPYVKAVELLAARDGSSLSAAEVVAVEDSPWGLQSARAAGLRTVAVAQTYAAASLDADLVLSTIAELDLRALERLIAA